MVKSSNFIWFFSFILIYAAIEEKKKVDADDWEVNDRNKRGKKKVSFACVHLGNNITLSGIG